MDKNCIISLILLIVPFVPMFSDDVIIPFEEKLAINIFSSYKSGDFSHNFNTDYATEEPWNIGLGIRYKNISAQFSIPISFSSSFDAEVNSYFDNLYYELFCKHYTDFYDDKQGDENNIGLDIFSTGISVAWVHNNKNHSLSSVLKMNMKQTASSGSLVYGFGTYFSSIYSNDRLSFYNDRQNILYFGPSIGYSYIFVFNNGFFMNLALSLRPNIGIGLNGTTVLFAPQVEPRIVIGHHHTAWSINLKMMHNSTIFLWNNSRIDMLGLATITMMFSRRI